MKLERESCLVIKKEILESTPTREERVMLEMFCVACTHGTCTNIFSSLTVQLHIPYKKDNR